MNPPENLKIFKDIPFLNGGLFDCLDEVPRVDNDIKEEVRLDGFSNTILNQVFVPDFIFWGEHKNIDLSKECDNPRKNRETVHGIFDILNAYKFTLEENTPLEEEIALDPELLGKVFENLLASYDPLTKTSARKQTGSYYTPRVIVNYMVDESLLAYLMHQLPEVGEEIFRSLLSYTEEETLLSEEEKNKIIVSIENLKILDPACGSGAFPMGMLHKLVFILGKVDPDNKKWFELLLKRMPHYTQSEMRKKLEGENWDYLRKLGIIQQSIYGIDIQPIAIQIAKLRFFISLLVDQKIRDTAENNYGLMPLPNLDFKLVCANTLISASETDEVTIALFAQNQDLFYKEFEMLTNRYFSTYLPEEKKKVRKQIEELITNKCNEKIERVKNIHEYLPKENRKKIRQLMQVKYEEHIQNKKNDIKLWESYKNLFKQKAVKFFDIKYFFPEVKEGFDVVIGNPPYVRADNPEIADLRKQIMASKKYLTLWEKWDLYVAFIEKGFELLSANGKLCFIIPDAYIASKYAEKSHSYFLENATIDRINFCSEVKIFDAAVKNIIIQYSKKAYPKNVPLRMQHVYSFENTTVLDSTSQIEAGEKTFKLNQDSSFLDSISDATNWEEICYVSYGLRPSSDERFWKSEFSKDDLISDVKDKIHPKRYIEAKWIKRFEIEKIKYLEWNTERSPAKLVRPTFPELYQSEKILFGGMTGAIYDDTGLLCNHSCSVSVLWKDLNGINNLSINNSVRKDFKVKGDKKEVFIFRKSLEDTSKNYSLKYLLSILNSKFGYYFLHTKRRSQLGFYPDDLKQLPIKNISIHDQQPFITLVNQILSAKSQNPSTDTSPLEKQIDEMVYKLYDLTDEEIKIIEGK